MISSQRVVKRLPFLDWMRGLALVMMIECHAFNSFARTDLRQTGAYLLSQFVGGMAGPLFLFMLGMTFAFLMDRLEQHELSGVRRWMACLRRAGYILAIALLIRIVDWITTWPLGKWTAILRVDILNSMGLALALFSAAAFLRGSWRIRVTLLAAVAIAAVSPLVAGLNWDSAPRLLYDYLSPGSGSDHFPFFPCASYVGFGIVAGAAVRLTDFSRMDRLMQWGALLGGTLILTGEYAANLPYAIYPLSDFWSNSPTLIFIRVGISLVLLAGSYLWTSYGTRWSWMQSIGRNSLLVYWVQGVLIYGPATRPLQASSSIFVTTVATVAMTALMVAVAAGWQWWRARTKITPAVASSPSPKGSKIPPRPLPE